MLSLHQFAWFFFFFRCFVVFLFVAIHFHRFNLPKESIYLLSNLNALFLFHGKKKTKNVQHLLSLLKSRSGKNTHQRLFSFCLSLSLFRESSATAVMRIKRKKMLLDTQDNAFIWFFKQVLRILDVKSSSSRKTDRVGGFDQY